MNKDKYVFAQLVEFLDTLLIINYLKDRLAHFYGTVVIFYINNAVLVACVLEHIFYFIHFLHILFVLLLLFKNLFFVYNKIAEGFVIVKLDSLVFERILIHVNIHDFKSHIVCG